MPVQTKTNLQNLQKKNTSIVVTGFDPITNFKATEKDVVLEMNLANAFTNGISIPASENVFKFAFDLTNNSDKEQEFFYKIYYQNESYKNTSVVNGVMYNQAASENFYGSWEDTDIGFKAIQKKLKQQESIKIKDSLRIVGNPRNEAKYFGAKVHQNKISYEEIKKKEAEIKSNKDWYSKIEDKAEEKGIDTQSQLTLDAEWSILDNRKNQTENNRWKRNPRTGEYSFLLVITTKEGLQNIPKHIININKTDDNNSFVNPYYYFLHAGKTNQNTIAILADKKLKTFATLSSETGVFLGEIPNNVNRKYDTTLFNEKSGITDQLFEKAHYEQFYHFIDSNFTLNNVSTAKNVVKDNYTQQEYHQNFSNNQPTKDPWSGYVTVTETPGKTVGYSFEDNAIFIKNPGYNSGEKLQKQNVAVKTRIGFTYGKYTAKIKFPKMLSEDNVWNGLTCAFWLLYQSDEPWNQRNICNNKGYLPKPEPWKSENRQAINNYSEIDIEIVKTSKYWPKTSYGIDSLYTPTDNGLNANLIVSCTNWDLACQDPSKFGTGVKEISYNEKKYFPHRWDDWYKALTLKTENPHSETVGDIYYYQIDWQPNRIIWRLGTNKDNMKVIGYMDSTITKIPNNQMIAIMSQEFHDASWWPTAPYSQNGVPFPLDDIIGYIYEITVE